MKIKSGSILLIILLIALVILATQSFILLPQQNKNLEEKLFSELDNLSERLYELQDVSLNPKESPKYGELIEVTRVIDGDTIELENGKHLRYIGIDTPELYDPRKPVQCFAAEASEANKNLVEGKNIKFYKDVNEGDKYQRLLGYVYLEDDTFVNLELVKLGYAFSYSYPPDISKQEEFLEAQKEARKKKLGLWSDCEISTSSSGILQTNPVNN